MMYYIKKFGFILVLVVLTILIFVFKSKKNTPSNNGKENLEGLDKLISETKESIDNLETNRKIDMAKAEVKEEAVKKELEDIKSSDATNEEKLKLLASLLNRQYNEKV